MRSKVIEHLRARQIRNALIFNLFSVGRPLLLMGEEMRRTQQGNNNPLLSKPTS